MDTEDCTTEAASDKSDHYHSTGVKASLGPDAWTYSKYSYFSPPAANCLLPAATLI